MKRFVGALAVLLAFVGLSRADFVIIIYNLAAPPQTGGNGQGGGFNGMFPGGGRGGFPGGGIGGMPGGAAGIGGGIPGGGMGGFRPGGAGGGIPPGGAVGVGGGVPGGAGGFPAGGGVPGGAGGVVPAGGGAGAGGAVPGGAGGFPAGGGVPGGMGGFPAGGGVPPGGAVGVGGGVPGGASGGVPPGGAAGVGGGAPGGFGGSGRPPANFGGSGGPGGGTSGSIPQPGGTSGGIPQPGGFGGSGSGGPPGSGTSGGIPQPGGFGGSGSGGMPGGIGGRGGMGMAGGMGLGGGFFQGGLGGLTPAPSFTPVWAMTIIEVDRVSFPAGPKVNLMHVHHKWGSSYILGQTPDKQISALYVQTPKSLSIKHLFADQRNIAYPGGKPVLDKLPAFAEWVLSYGMLDEFEKAMTDWAALDNKDDRVRAYQQMKAEMDKEITQPDPDGRWKNTVLAGYKSEPSKHYTLMHKIEAAHPADVKSRLDRLEANYRAFFYWFAMHGKTLPVPKQRMVAVLVKSAGEFKRQQAIFDASAGETDGFLARRENLAIFSLERTDPASDALAKSTQSLFRDVINREFVLQKWPMIPSQTGARKGQEAPLLMGSEIQTVALLERALSEDSELATATHEGTRQLLAATEQLSRNVSVPHWLQFGWGLFFETPKGSPWMTIGAPSSTILADYNYLDQFKAAAKAGKLGTQKAAALIAVVTDQNFRDYAANPKSAEARNKAHTMAWSLVYYLAREHLDGLMRYHAELQKLPRDLEFDSKTLLMAFARAFDCLDAARPNEVDTTKLERSGERLVGLHRTDAIGA